jgi:hypothetical protein
VTHVLSRVAVDAVVQRPCSNTQSDIANHLRVSRAPPAAP